MANHPGRNNNQSAWIAALLARPTGQRSIVAIAGPPGVGKSTFAANSRDQFNARRADCCQVMAMDGFHYDDRVLAGRGWQSEKGAPHTFDIGGLQSILARLRANEEPEIAVPVFDRDIEIARGSAQIIKQSVDIVLVEGNYLLLATPPWDRLFPLFEVTVMLDAPDDILRKRLNARWEGQNLPAELIAEKVEGNDLANAKTVKSESRTADYRIETG